MVPPGVNAGEEMARVAMASRNSRRNIVGSECMLKGPRGSSRARPAALEAALPLAIASLAACTGERPVPATSAGDWIVGATPIFTIGATEAGPGQELARVSGARWAGGRIVSANSGSGELRVFDSAGTFRGAEGRKGQGPGEFLGVIYLAPAAADSLYTFDAGNLRWSLHDGAGRFVRVLRGGASALPRPAWLYDRTLVESKTQPRLPGGGGWRGSARRGGARGRGAGPPRPGGRPGVPLGDRLARAERLVGLRRPRAGGRTSRPAGRLCHVPGRARSRAGGRARRDGPGGRAGVFAPPGRGTQAAGRGTGGGGRPPRPPARGADGIRPDRGAHHGAGGLLLQAWTLYRRGGQSHRIAHVRRGGGAARGGRAPLGRDPLRPGFEGDVRRRGGLPRPGRLDRRDAGLRPVGGHRSAVTVDCER